MTIATEKEISDLYDLEYQYIQQQKHKFFAEKDLEICVMVRIAKLFKEQGHIIDSKSAISLTALKNLDYQQEYESISDRTHFGGFDLHVLAEGWERIGIEVKGVLTMARFENALGQCISRLAQNKADKAIIYAKKYANEKTRKTIEKILIRLDLQSLSVKVLE